MSSETPISKQSEEVDLGQLFKLIGRAFDRFFKFIGSIFKGVFSIIIYSLKAIIVNFKIIAITMFLAFVLGYTIERIQPTKYKSHMLVKPYFESKYQLVNSIDYYNSLIAEKDYVQLKNIFNIDYESAKQLVEIEITKGPESKNSIIYEYNEFIKSLDSVTASKISFDEFANNRNLYSASTYEINVISKKRDIFKSLEKGFNKTLTNSYSIKKKQQRDSLIALDKKRIMNSLKQVDSLKRVYIEVLKNESTSNNKSQSLLTFNEGGMALAQDRVKTKEYELLQTEFKLEQELNNLESSIVRDDVLFDTISSFQEIGSKHKKIYERYSVIFPLLSFYLLIIGYLLIKIIVFTKKYEG